MQQQQQPKGQNNIRYKTMICKHYNTTQGCSYGDKCQFAHGPQELKIYNPNSFSDNQIDFSKNQKSLLNYKIVKCKNWEKDGTCKYGKHCTFAHGDDELRSKNENIYQMQPQMLYNPFIDPMMLQMQMMNNNYFDGNQIQNFNPLINGQVDQNQLMMGMNMNGNNLNNFNGNNLNGNELNLNNLNMNNMNNLNMNNMNNLNMNNMNNFGLNNYGMNNLSENNLNGNINMNNNGFENLQGNENGLNDGMEQ